MATMTLFFAVGMWNDWFGPLIYFTDSDRYPITLFLRNILVSAKTFAVESKSAQAMIEGEQGFEPAESLKGAAIMLVTIPILVVYPFVQKHFVQGVMIGSVKG